MGGTTEQQARHQQLGYMRSDASVETTITMMDKKNNRVVATGTSPDIIVASVNAFVEGYNVLWSRQKE